MKDCPKITTMKTISGTAAFNRSFLNPLINKTIAHMQKQAGTTKIRKITGKAMINGVKACTSSFLNHLNKWRTIAHNAKQ
jgi:hypothetical protein